MNPIETFITENPVFHREWRSRWPRRRFWLLPGLAWGITWAALLFIVMLSTLFVYDGPDVNDVAPTVGASLNAVGAFVVALLCPPALFASIIATEREQRRLEMLMITRLTNSQIIMGKWAANAAPLFLTVMPLAFATAIFAVWGAVADTGPWGNAMWVLLGAQILNIPLLLLFGSAVSTFFSVVCSTVRAATAWSYAATIGVYGLTKHGVYLLALFGVRVNYDPKLNAEFAIRLLFPWLVWSILTVVCFWGAHFMLGREAERQGRGL